MKINKLEMIKKRKSIKRQYNKSMKVLISYIEYLIYINYLCFVKKTLGNENSRRI